MIVLKVLAELGWEVSVDKLKPHDVLFEALGVLFDLASLSTKGSIVVSNTVKRKISIDRDICETLTSGYLAADDAATLRGRMQFGEAQHWGRVLSITARQLSLRATGHGSGLVTGDLLESLLIARWLINNAKPRTIQPWLEEPCNLIFVDAAADSIEMTSSQKLGVGGALFSHRLLLPRHFGFRLQQDIVDHWQSTGSQQVIGQAELLPILIAKRAWKYELSYSRNLWFIDNESARESIIRSYSPIWTSREILVQIKIEDMKASSVDWYARVPTNANWGDGPSRLEFADVEALGSVEQVVAPLSLAKLTGVNVLELLAQ